LFEFDASTGDLAREGVAVRLQPQPARVLSVLVSQPQTVVSRDSLRRQIWPDGTFVDFEHSLNAAVKRLRAALGDDARAPRYVETLPRLGYRWINAAIPLDSRSDLSAQIGDGGDERIEIVWT